jgi:hypothetical protein
MIILLLACAAQDPTTTESETIEVCGETFDVTDCETSVSDVFPPNEAVDAYYRAAVEWTLSEAAPEAVACMDGVPGSFSLNETEDLVIFQPDDPLQASTDYTATLGTCRGRVDIGFRTSELGAPVDVEALEGRVFILSVEDAQVVVPDNVGSLVAPYIAEAEGQILFSVVEAGEVLRLRGAIATDSGEQDTCQLTYELSETAFDDNPHFQVGFAELTFEADQAMLSVTDGQLSGDFTADLERFERGGLTGLFDARALAGIIDGYETSEEICGFIETLGVSCEICTDGEPACLSVAVTGATGELVSTEGLVSVEVENCHESCPDRVPEDCP